ncbi:MAG: response regulator [Bacteroidia bacterium]
MKKSNKAGKASKYDNVLLIDDNEIDNFINERIITTSDFADHVVVESSGNSALDYLKRTLEKEQDLPRIIFLDLNMPVMDGFGFLDEYDKLFQKYPRMKDETKVIVLSSSISPADLDRASKSPYVYKYLNKPLNEKYLEAINI